MEKKELLIIVDYYNFLYRAFYGIQQRLTSPDGTPVNALYGIITMMNRLINEYKPSSIIVVKEGGNNWRKNIYAEYKTNRSKMPEDLIKQIPYIDEFFNLMGFPVYSLPGEEADDVMATLAVKSSFNKVYLATTDKDLYQIIDDKKIYVLDTMKNILYDSIKVKEKFGVNPDQIIDYLSLVGDSSDNIPGAKGVGEKTAIKLINEFGNIENLIKNSSQLSGKVLLNIENSKEMIILSKKLVTLNLNLNIVESYDSTLSLNKELINAFLKKLNMVSLINKI